MDLMCFITEINFFLSVRLSVAACTNSEMKYELVQCILFSMHFSTLLRVFDALLWWQWRAPSTSSYAVGALVFRNLWTGTALIHFIACPACHFFSGFLIIMNENFPSTFHYPEMAATSTYVVICVKYVITSSYCRSKNYYRHIIDSEDIFNWEKEMAQSPVWILFGNCLLRVFEHFWPLT